MTKATDTDALLDDPEAKEIGDDVLDNAAALMGHSFPKPEKSAGDGEEKKSKAAAEDDDDEDADKDAAAEQEAKVAAAGDDADTDKTEAETDIDEGKKDGEDEEADDDADKTAEESAQFVNTKLKDLPKPVRERVQGVIDSRVGKITAEAKAEQARLEARIEELSDEVEDAKKQGGAAPVNIPGLHPLFLVGSETELEQRLTQIENFDDFVEAHPEGSEGDPARNIPAWTVEQIKARQRELHRERDRVIPAVRRNLQARVAQDADLKKTYPVLFDRKSSDYRDGQELLKLMPELRRHPNQNVLLAQLVLGKKALAELTKMKTGAPAKIVTEPVKKAPRVPGTGGPAKGGALDRRTEGPDSTQAVSKFMKNPGRKSFADAVAAVI